MANAYHWWNGKELERLLEEEQLKNEQLSARVAQLEQEVAQLRSRRAAGPEDPFLRPGTLAEEALRISGVFEAADRAAEQYRISLERMQEKLRRAYRRELEAQAQEPAPETEAAPAPSREEVPEPAPEEAPRTKRRHKPISLHSRPEEETQRPAGKPVEPVQEPAEAVSAPEESFAYAPEELESARSDDDDWDFGSFLGDRPRPAQPEALEEELEEPAEAVPASGEEVPQETAPGGRDIRRRKRTINFVPDENEEFEEERPGGQRRFGRRSTRKNAKEPTGDNDRYLPWDTIDDEDDVMREWSAAFDEEEEGL